MDTPVLKRRLNPFLLATTVLVLSLLAGLSVMYQGQLSDILSDKKSLEDKLEDRKQEISNLQSENANLSEQLQEKNSRINSLASESSSLESEVNSLESDIDTLESQNAELEDDITLLEDQKESLNDTIELMNVTIGLICDAENNTIEDGEDKCEDWGHEFEGSEP
jgi:chromosome segregation ATPase